MSTYVVVPADAPAAYWEAWADRYSTVVTATPDGERDLVHILQTRRCGDDGRFDAQYLVDRLGSGLHFATRHASRLDASEEAFRMADILESRQS